MSKGRQVASSFSIDAPVELSGTPDNPSGMEPNWKAIAKGVDVRDFYEDRLGKYADLIQRFVDHNDKWVGNGCLEADMEWDAIVGDCIAIGFKPSDQ